MVESTRGKGKVMIVDDALVNLRLLTLILTKYGYLVHGVDNGADALIDAVRIQPDLILLDIMMPDIDGYSVCQRLKESVKTKDIPVIFLSAMNEVVDKIKAFAVGGVDFITKPFQVEEVLVRIDTHITLRSVEQGLQKQVTTLNESNADLSAFAHMVAHDLKAPLANILLGTELLLEYTTNPQIDSTIATIAEKVDISARKLVSIIDEMLLMASTRNDNIAHEPLNMAEIVSQVQDRLSWMIAQYKGEIILPQAWPIAQGYGPWVEEIWANYISNGLKYGGSPPRLELGADIPERSMIKFWLRDNGPGIAQEELESLFSEFQRKGHKHVDGHGLGLSIVKRIATKLGGQVAVETELGRGSTFSFILPAHHADGIYA